VSETADEERKPIAEVLQGLEIHPVEPGWTAIEALVLVHTDVLRRELADEWLDDESDDHP
jgi:hypothetical protein